jgi:Fe-S cluster assembly ATPase SufC
MLFHVENLGPLREAEVDLSKRLIVLTGPNSTGKTYLAWSVYGLHRMSSQGGGVFARWAQELLGSPGHRIDLGERFAKSREETFATLAAEYLRQVHRCFAAERSRFQGTTLSLREDDGAPLNELKPEASIHSRQVAEHFVCVHSVPGTTQCALKLVDIGADFSSVISSVFTTVSPTPGADERTSAVLATASPEDRTEVERFVSTLLFRVFADALLPRCVLFPAERIAVSIFAKELSLRRTELVDDLVDADLEGQREVPLAAIRRRVGRYPWPIRDSLLAANDLARMSRQDSPHADLAAELERAVLGGKVGISEEGEMLFTPEDAPEHRLGVHLTASVVKSLSSLVFYFRHQASEGEFLIIDEPELNLHPDNQRRVARVLARAVNRGFKVMMSTHSDCLIRELNHLIMASKLSGDEARELGYDPDCTIHPDKVGVYLFEEHQAKPIPVSETGFSVQTIDREINALNADAQRLYARLFG